MFKTIVLLDIKYSENIFPSVVNLNLKDFFGKPVYSPVPEIKEDLKEFQTIYIEELFKSSLFRIASFFEQYLNDLIHELFWHNKSLLLKYNTKIIVSDILKFKNLEEFENDLIDNLTISILMKPYHKLVDTFQNKFYIGIHTKKLLFLANYIDYQAKERWDTSVKT